MLFPDADPEPLAILSEDGRYRYLLRRIWAARPTRLGFVMLNPSTADAEVDDPTIRRCIGFAKRYGASSLVVGNLYALRTHDPDVLFKTPEFERVGDDNETWLRQLIWEADSIVFAWGADRRVDPGLVRKVSAMCRLNGKPPLCLGTTSHGGPSHPLFVPAIQPMVPFNE